MSSPQLLSNRYELEETLGYGGMSEVHHAHDVRLGREVAVKILRADLARDPQFQERFRREAQNAAALNHPAIVAVYDTGEAQSEYGPLPYIVMEYVDGRTLREIVKTEGPLSQKRAMEVMADVCAALDFSHRHGIVHRDVKPANVMITKTGAVKVMDFGIARAIHDGQSAMTQTAAVIGTAQYLSPEQARGENVDARSDVYAAGCVLYELVVGDPPFVGDSPVAVAYQHVREDPTPPSSMVPAISPELDAVILKSLAKGQPNRYQSAAEMRSDLVRTLSGQRPSAPMVMTDDDRTRAMHTGGHAADYDEYDPDAYGKYNPAEQERSRRKRRNRLAAALIAVGVIAVGLVMWMAGLFGGNNDLTAVPDVVGEYEAEAKGKLHEAGFDNVATELRPCRPRNDAPPTCTADDIGKVVAIDPQADVGVPTTNKITLTVGKQPEQVNVPNLVGKTRDEAEQLLTQAGLLLDQNVEQVDVDNPDQYGKVLGQEPEADLRLEQGQTVHIRVGKTPRLVQVTDYTGRSYAEAKAGLEGAGFTVQREEVDSDKPQNTVVSQQPNGGNVPENETIRLGVSNGSKQQIQMPDLVGKTQSEALSALRDAGWSGESNTRADPVSDPTDEGKVTNTNPQQGSQITKDQTITLFVGELRTTTTPSPPPPTTTTSRSPGLPIPGLPE